MGKNLRSYALATGAALLAAGLMGVSFWFWRERTFASAGETTLELAEKLETQGLIPFDYETIDGEKNRFDLASAAGKVVILNFWASWCGPCIEEIPSLMNLVKHYRGRVKLIAVSSDRNLSDVTEFLKAFPKTSDPNIATVWEGYKEIVSAYEVERLPESFVFGPDGKLRKKIVGSIDWFTDDAKQYMDSLLAESPR